MSFKLKKAKVGIIGAGNIGSALHRKIQSMGWDVCFILKDNGIYRNLSEKIGELKDYQSHPDIHGVDAVFLAIPTFDDGKIAFNYFKFFLERNIPVITCEKGALSNYFGELENWKNLIGYSATVGGGSRLLRYLESQTSCNVAEIHAVINGTLNFIFSEIASGRSFGEVIEEARKLGYTEPGAKNPIDILNKEVLLDIPMKTSILFNVANLTTERIVARNIEARKITESDLEELIKKAEKIRYIVSITKSEAQEGKLIGGFKYKVGDWIISGGFKDVESNHLFADLLVSGVNNALVICDGVYGKDGIYKVVGPGAGAEPTAASMIKDCLCFLK